MKTSIIFGLIVLSSLILASCSDTTSPTKTQTSPTPTPVATTPPTSKDNSMAGMDHSKMDM